jgi:Ca-activated chloride channel family protein
LYAAKPAIAGDAENAQTASAKVRQIGSKTFYWKKERWTDSSVTQEEDEKATVIAQLSDEYFRLARAQKAENNQYLSQTEPLTVKLEGKVYRIDPPKSEPSR